MQAFINYNFNSCAFGSAQHAALPHSSAPLLAAPSFLPFASFRDKPGETEFWDKKARRALRIPSLAFFERCRKLFHPYRDTGISVTIWFRYEVLENPRFSLTTPHQMFLCDHKM
jgi:hypothetical protein